MDFPKYKFPLSETDLFSSKYPLAKKILKTMTIGEKIGQLFFFKYNRNGIDEEIKKYHPGGYILYSENFENQTPESIKEELKNKQKLSKIILGLAVDEEGGTVVRVSQYPSFRIEPFKSPKILYNEGGIENILKTEFEKIELLKSINLNINLAPVADISLNENNFISKRVLGQNVEITSNYIKEQIKQSVKLNFTQCLKHFPGYSDNGDSHLNIIYDNRDFEIIRKNDIIPFQAGINEKVPFVLIAHIILTKINQNYPASISSESHKFLREELKFSGLILTDSLVMKGIELNNLNYPSSVLAVLAGNDIILPFENSKNYHEVLDAFNNKIIDEDIIDCAVTRILAWKLTYFENEMKNFVDYINEL